MHKYVVTFVVVVGGGWGVVTISPELGQISGTSVTFITLTKSIHVTVSSFSCWDV